MESYEIPLYYISAVFLSFTTSKRGSAIHELLARGFFQLADAVFIDFR
jgi:hypothetical protein